MPDDGVRLDALAKALEGEVIGDGSTLITDVVHDSRDARTGSAYVAVRGFTVDGHRFVDSVVGVAAAAIVDHEVPAAIPQLVVADTRALMGRAASIVHGRPTAQVPVVGVTGTNGKTTVTYLLEAIGRAAGRSVARLGTTGAVIAGDHLPMPRTTPEATDLHRLFRAMVDQRVEMAAIEVSSHALRLHRVGGVHFAVAAFTNLSQDHLDFHVDMEDYFDAKRQLFDGRAAVNVIWTDDPYGARLAAEVPGATLVGFERGDVHASDVEIGLSGSTFTLVAHGETAYVDLPIGGAFNVANALIAAACARHLEVDLDEIASGLANVGPVPGRMEPVLAGQEFPVLVDYAHSPGGVETVVADARRLTDGRVIVVVGAAGDRDREKRPLMGRAAASGDVAIITSDNPRSEDPQELVDAVTAGARDGTAEVFAEVDRRAAVRMAVEMAQRGDVVLILGKGHEQGQTFADGTIPFDDRTVAAEEIRASGVGA